MAPIVIIGTGLAGYTLARELRRSGYAGAVTLLTADDGAFYSKPMLSNALAQGKTAEALVMSTVSQMAETLRATIHPHRRLAAIHPTEKHLVVDGETIAYGKLVLAWGADPIRLPLAGERAAKVLSVNDRQDYARFRAALAPAQRVAILGGGLIGCEFANDLRTAGKEVTVIDLAPWPLGRLLPEALGKTVAAGLAAAGVRWHLGRTVAEVGGGADGAFRLRLDDGATVDGDVVLSAVGLAPRTRLAATAGLQVGRGIVTDNFLATSDPSIFALGDCAEVGGQVRPFVLPITHGAKALARTLAGTPTPVAYPPMPVVVKTPAIPLVVCPPAPGSAGNWQVDVVTDGLRALFRDPQGRLTGFALAGKATAEKQALAAQLASTTA